MYVCMYVCMYVYIYIYIYLSLTTQTHMALHFKLLQAMVGATAAFPQPSEAMLWQGCAASGLRGLDQRTRLSWVEKPKEVRLQNIDRKKIDQIDTSIE